MAYENMNTEFAQRLQAFFAAAPPGLLGPGSGYRSYEQQAKLYQDYKNGVPGQARAAPPGRSLHNHGLAMDIAYNENRRAEAVAWAHQNAARFGLYFPMDDEDWHVQPIGLDGRGGQHDKYDHKAGLQAAGVDPQDDLANRMYQVMQILGGANSAEGLLDDEGNAIGANPLHSKYVSNMFSGNAHMGSFPQTMITDVDDSSVQGRYQKYAMKRMAERYGWGPEEFKALDILWGTKESGWNPRADNPTSTAAGIAQKLQSVHGPVEPTGEGQIDWGLQYIAGRYGSPSAALKFHESNNWY